MRPRRASVCRLVDEVRDPGDEQDTGAHKRQHGVAHEAAPILRHKQHWDQRQHRADEEKDAPGVRVEHQRERGGEEHEVAPSPEQEAVQVSRGRNQPQQRHQLVHAGLFGVLGQPGVEGEHHRGEDADPTAEQAPTRPHSHGNRQQAEDQGEGVRGGLAGAERTHPEMQQQVVERRVAVVAQDARNRAQRVGGDARRDRLVDPELARERPGSHIRRYRHQHHEHA
jgi:hypothetical protein